RRADRQLRPRQKPPRGHRNSARRLRRSVMRRWRITAALGALGLASLLVAERPGALSAGEAAVQAVANVAAVRIDNFNFTPPDLVVAPGTTVTWTNADDSPHT